MQWPWEMVEAEHLIQNPTSVEKIQLLAQYMRLDLLDAGRVLDQMLGLDHLPRPLHAPTVSARAIARSPA